MTQFWTDSDGDPGTYTQIERVDFQSNSELFGPTGPSFEQARTMHLAFSPPGWRGGDLILVTLRSPVHNLSIIRALDPQRVLQFLPGHLLGGTGPAAVDPFGDFDFDIFWHSDYAHPPDSGIFRVDADGNETFFADLVLGEMRFGPGGDWGNDLYVGGLTFAPDGTPSAFPVEFTEFDWVPGPGFDGDMFARIAGEDDGEIYRIEPDGSRRLFARNLPGEIAACNGDLWIANDRGCLVVERRGRGPGPRGSLTPRER